jgi:hypothetical protein
MTSRVFVLNRRSTNGSYKNQSSAFFGFSTIIARDGDARDDDPDEEAVQDADRR